MSKPGIIGIPEDPHKKGGPFPSGPEKYDGTGSVPTPTDEALLRAKVRTIKPMPDWFWRASNPIIQALRSCINGKPPRNVQNYRIQELPDGCHNCEHLYCGMWNGLACGLACITPDKPSFCDLVSPLGICDK